jgi:hypothetical protein
VTGFNTAPPTPEVVFDQAQRLLLCVSEQLAATPAGSPARAAVVPGAQIAWDNCECGQLTVHTLEMVPADQFPVQKQLPPFNDCGFGWWVTHYVVTILRCVHIQDEAGNPPPAADLQADAAIDLRDRWAVRQGVACCMAAYKAANPVVPFAWVPQSQLAVGAEGMCMGSEFHLLVGFPACGDC